MENTTIQRLEDCKTLDDLIAYCDPHFSQQTNLLYILQEVPSALKMAYELGKSSK